MKEIAKVKAQRIAWIALSAVAVVVMWPFPIFYNPLTLPFWMPLDWLFPEYAVWAGFVPVASILASVVIVFTCLALIDRFPKWWVLLIVVISGITVLTLLGYFNFHGSITVRLPDDAGTMWVKGKKVPSYGTGKDGGRIFILGTSLNLMVAMFLRLQMSRRGLTLLQLLMPKWFKPKAPPISPEA